MSEHDTQCAFNEWCKWNEKKYPALKLSFAIPNGGKRNIITATKMKAEGVRPGVPDWHLPVPVGGYSGLWIEFKFGKNKLSDNQRDYIGLLEKSRHVVAVCYTSEEATRAVIGYLNSTQGNAAP